MSALKAQRASSQLKSEYIFPNAVGGPLDRDNLSNRVWYPALRRAGLKTRKPYQTRHTFASLALAAGENIAWVADELGHTTPPRPSSRGRWLRPRATPEAIIPRGLSIGAGHGPRGTPAW